MENIHEGHRKRMKERFIKSGLDDFAPHNVLELLLFYSIPRGDTNPVAHRLIDTFGSLSGVFDATPEELAKVDGVGENSAILISMIPQIARKYLEDKADTANIVGGCSDIGAFLLPKFVGRTNEALMMVSIDNKNKIISCSVVAEGTVDSAKVSRRKIMEEAIKVKATRVILAHNHPCGVAVPSSEDVVMTKEIGRLFAQVGIELVDNIIVANDDYVSMAASGFAIK